MFGAGVVVEDRGSVLGTLNRDWLPDGFVGFRLGGVGGVCEPGETPWQTIMRETLEETGCELVLSDSPRTWYWQVGREEPIRVECVERPAPLLVERRPGDVQPGDFFGATFLGSVVGEPAPADDVEALIYVPRADWPRTETTVGALVAAGARVIGSADPAARVWVHPDETFATALALR